MNATPTDTKTSKNSARNSTFGEILEWKSNRTGLEGRSKRSIFKITVYQDGIIRVQASRMESFEPNPYSVVSSPEQTAFKLEESQEKLILKTNLLKLEIDLASFRLSFYDQSGKLLNQDDSLGISWIGTEVSNYKEVQLNEKFLGLGEKTGNLNRFGKAYTNWNTDYFAYGVGDDPLYMSIPFYIGTHEKGSYGIFFDNTHKTVFNFGASTNRFIYFSAEDGDIDYYFIHHNSISEIISAYTWLTGRMQMPPKWALGFQQALGIDARARALSGQRVVIDVRLARRGLDAADVLVILHLLLRAGGKVGAGADHPALRGDEAGTRQRRNRAFDIGVVERVDRIGIAEVLQRRRPFAQHEAVGVQREVIADRHPVAHRHRVVEVIPGVHFRAPADIAPGHVIAVPQIADQRRRGAGIRLSPHFYTEPKVIEETLALLQQLATA